MSEQFQSSRDQDESLKRIADVIADPTCNKIIDEVLRINRQVQNGRSMIDVGEQAAIKAFNDLWPLSGDQVTVTGWVSRAGDTEHGKSWMLDELAISEGFSVESVLTPDRRLIRLICHSLILDEDNPRRFVAPPDELMVDHDELTVDRSIDYLRYFYPELIDEIDRRFHGARQPIDRAVVMLRSLRINAPRDQYGTEKMTHLVKYLDSRVSIDVPASLLEISGTCYESLNDLGRGIDYTDVGAYNLSSLQFYEESPPADKGIKNTTWAPIALGRRQSSPGHNLPERLYIPLESIVAVHPAFYG